MLVPRILDPRKPISALAMALNACMRLACKGWKTYSKIRNHQSNYWDQGKKIRLDLDRCVPNSYPSKNLMWVWLLNSIGSICFTRMWLNYGRESHNVTFTLSFKYTFFHSTRKSLHAANYSKVLGGFDGWRRRRVPIRARISPMSVEWTPPDPGTIWSDGASWSTIHTVNSILKSARELGKERRIACKILESGKPQQFQSS